MKSLITVCIIMPLFGSITVLLGNYMGFEECVLYLLGGIVYCSIVNFLKD